MLVCKTYTIASLSFKQNSEGYSLTVWVFEKSIIYIVEKYCVQQVYVVNFFPFLCECIFKKHLLNVHNTYVVFCYVCSVCRHCFLRYVTSKFTSYVNTVLRIYYKYPHGNQIEKYFCIHTSYNIIWELTCEGSYSCILKTNNTWIL